MQTLSFLQEIRKTSGFSAAELAKRAGVSRQTIYAMEDGNFVPNTTIALRLAHILGVTVEQLFTLHEEASAELVKAELLPGKSGIVEDGQFVRLCRVNGRMTAVPVPLFPAYLPAADGVVRGRPARCASVESAAGPSFKGGQFLLAGCDPALSLLSEVLNHSRYEVVAVPCSSRRALEWLREGRVHAAGSHLFDSASGNYNVPAVKRAFPQGGVRIVTFAMWEQGIVLGRGNPKSVRTVADLASKGVTLINREKGSGSRDLLDKHLRKVGIRAERVMGYESLANGHLSAAYAVASGVADCCVATRSAARCFGLDFIPLAIERFDLSFPETSLSIPAARALLDEMNGSKLKRRLEAMAGYDTAHTGEVVV